MLGNLSNFANLSAIITPAIAPGYALPSPTCAEQRAESDKRRTSPATLTQCTDAGPQAQAGRDVWWEARALVEPHVAAAKFMWNKVVEITSVHGAAVRQRRGSGW